MTVRNLITFLLFSGMYFSSLGQTEWVSYSRDDIGMSTIEKVQKVSWTKIESQTNQTKAVKIATDKTLRVISNVKEEKLPKVNFETVNVLRTEVIENLKFEFREIAKIDISCLSKLRAPYLSGIQAVAQFSNGKMIFGGFDMICIYDGYRMEVFNSSSEYTFNEIFSIVIDDKDRAWIASDGGISYYENGQFFKASNLEVGKVWNYWIDDNKDVYVASCNNGIYILGKDNTDHIFKKDKIQEVFDFERDKNGTLWYGLDNGLAFKHDGEWFEYPFGIVQGSIRSLLEVGERLYISTFQDGLYCLENNKVFRIVIPIADGNSIYNLQLVDGELWVPIYGRGVLVLNNNLEYYQLRERDGLVGDQSIKVFLDSFGNIWVTENSNGISKIRNTKFEPKYYEIPNFKNRKRIKNNNVNWYFGDNGRIYREIDGKYFILDYRGDYYLQDGDVNGVEFAALSNFYPGIQLYRDGKIHMYNTEEDEYKRTFTTPIFGNYDEVYFANYYEEIRVFKNDSVFNLTLLPELSNRRLQQFVKAENGSIAARVNNAVVFFEENSYLLIDESKGLFSNWIYTILPWQENKFCVLMDKGVQVIENGIIIESYPIELFSKGKKCIAKNIGSNEILVISNMEMFILKIHNGKIDKKEIDYTKGTYLVDHRLMDTPDSNVCMIKNTLCYSFNPHKKQRASISPSLILDSTYINGVPIISGEIKLSQDDDLNFKFTSVSLMEMGEMEYKLIKNKALIYEGNSLIREIEFSNLIKGNYKLQVVHVAGGKTSDTITIEFVVLPFWYQTVWFYIAVFLSFITVAFIWLKRRVKKGEENKIRLESIVAEKTHELIVEKRSVEQQLVEKEVLLKEINHRVKNNMQMVSSLLELQAGRSKSDVEKQTLKNAGVRIKSLAYAHQELYLSTDYSNLNLASYLKLLVSKLLDNSEVIYTIEVASLLVVDIEKAQAIGIVINELITNSIQHAWPEDVEKSIQIDIKKDQEQLVLQYKDNGIGLDKELETNKSKSLGFTLIKSFATRQLNGTFSIENDNGFVFILQFTP